MQLLATILVTSFPLEHERTRIDLRALFAINWYTKHVNF